MSFIKRRQFLQFAGSALATLGISQLEIEQQAIRYAKVLAQNTPRKLALLVGINRYDDPKWVSLNGAIYDTQLQKELLIHRFGFNPSDIHILPESDATRQNILQAFDEYLIKSAKPGDVVVFHFSGHGSQVVDTDKVFTKGRVSTIVPIDGDLPTGYPKKGGNVQDITGHTLWLLMQAINTENLTFVLDSCHSGGARKGILTVRSRPGDRQLWRTQDPTIQLLASPQEQEYRQAMMSRLKLNAADVSAQRRISVPKGVMLYAAQTEQEAFDAPFGDISAGIFTYVLTRYLWQETGDDALSKVMVSTTNTTQRIIDEYFPSSQSVQKPDFNFKQGSDNDKQAVYFLSRKNIPAEAVITKVSRWVELIIR
jgi:Caspase domain